MFAHQMMFHYQENKKISPWSWREKLGNLIKSLVSRILENLKIQHKKAGIPLQKWTKYLNKHFSKESIQINDP